MASEATIAMSLVVASAVFDRRIKRSAKNIGRLRKQTNVATKAFRRMGQAATGAATAFIGLAGIRVVARGLLNAGKRAEDFNQAMRSSLAIMGDVSTFMRQEMKQAAFDVAAATKFAAKEIAESFFFLASAGLKAEQQIAALPLVAKFAQAGMFDMRQATDLLTDAQSALGLTVDDAQQNLKNMTRVADVLVKANTLANASVQQFSEALTNKAAAAFKFYGIEVEEGVALLAAFADQGIKSAEAGTAINIVLRELTTKSQTNAKAFREAGIRVFEYGGSLRKVADTIGDLENAMDGLSTKQRKLLLLQLGFQDKSSVFIQALLEMSEKIKEWEEAGKGAAGITEQIADKQLTNLDRQLGIVKSAWTKMATAMQLGNTAAKVVLKLNIAMITLGIATEQAKEKMTSFFIVALPAIEKVEEAGRGLFDSLVDIGITIKRALGFRAEAIKAVESTEKVTEALRKGFVQARRYEGGIRSLSLKEQIAAEITEELEAKQDKLIQTLERQVRVFGLSDRQLTLSRLGVLKAKDEVKALANSLFDQMDAQKRSNELVSEAAAGQKSFADLLAKTRQEIADFGKSDIEKTLGRLTRAFKGAVLDKAAINQIRILTQVLDDMKQKASAFDTLKQKALNLFKATRNPLEKYNEEVALLNKLASTIDPNTGKALIDTDTLNRGLKAALDNLNALKRAARADSFISGQKREFVRQFGGSVIPAGQQAGRRGSNLFKQFGKTPPGGILQGAPPNLFAGPGRIHPRPITADTSTLAGSTSETLLTRIEALLISGLTRTEKTRVN